MTRGISSEEPMPLLFCPFSLKRALRPSAKAPVAIGAMTRAELDAELAKGIESLRDGTYTTEEIDSMMAEDFGL